MQRVASRTERAAAAIAVRRLGAHLAAEIGGVDLRRELDDGTVDAIGAALAEHGLLLFRGQDISADQLMAFGRRFGELSVHPFAPNDDDVPALIRFENDEKTPPFGTDIWHSDETFRAEPPMATFLCAKEVPEIGGDTVYASMAAAYDGLSDRMQRFISGLEAIHDFKPFKPLFGDDEAGRLKLQHYERLYPPAVHPVVRVHPITGRKVLFVNPQFTIAIKGMDERESRSLLDTLFHQALVPEYQYRLHWQPHTLAVWDNRSVQHYAVHDYYPQRRIMERVTVKGDRPLGVERADPASLRRAKYVPVAGADLHGGHEPNRQFRRDG